jgi:hypothetical protein
MAQKTDLVKRSPSLVRAFAQVLKQFGWMATSPWSAPKLSQRMAKAVLAVTISLFVGLGGRLRLSNGHASVFMPLWVYDMCANLLFGINWAIGATTFCLNALPLQSSPDWNTKPDLSPDKIASSPEALDGAGLEKMKLAILQDKSPWMNERHLVQLFDSLEPAKPETLRGKAYRGRILRCGRFLDLADLFVVQPLRLLGLKWGKRYRAQYVGDPLCVTWLERLHIPLPAWGNVGMHGITYRGRNCATMAYDHQPWHDMFVVLDDGSASGRIKVLGLWTHRQKSGGWFTLTELPEIDVTI